MSRWSAPRSLPRIVVSGLAASAALLVVLAAAAAEAEPVALSYVATEEGTRGACPSQAAFFAMVRAHTSRWSAVPEGSPVERRIRVRLSARAGETTGTLAVEDAAGTLPERTIVGPTCAGVARALAIMVGVALDPRAETPGDAPDHDADAANREEAGDAAPRRDSGPERRPADAPHARSATRPNQPSFESSVAFDLRLEATSAVIRGSLLAVGASMRLVIPVASGPAWLHGWKPSIGLGMRQSLPKERSFRGGDVDFAWTAGNLRLCPHQIAMSSVVELAPCAEMNLGVLRASADGFTNARRPSITWFDVGGSVWAAVSLGRRIFLSATVLVTAPLVRRPFVLASGTTAASVPAVGLLFGLGVGTRL